MTYELGRALLLSDAVSPEALATALFTASTEHVSLVRALLATRAIEPGRLEEELARVDAPLMRHVAPVFSLMEQLPAGLCARLVAVPVRRDPRTGTIDVAVADARDPHAAEEISFFLGAPVRLVRAPLAAIEAALGRPNTPAGPGGVRALAPPMATPPPGPVRRIAASTPLWGTPVLNLVEQEEEEAEAQTQEQEEEQDAPESEGQAVALVADIPIPLSRKVFYADEIGSASHDPGLEEVIASAFAPTTTETDLVAPHAHDVPLEDGVSEDPLPSDEADWDAPHDDTPQYEYLGESDEDGQPILELRTKPPSEKPSTSDAGIRATSTINETTIDAILEEITRVTQRDELLELVLLGARTITRKAALFIVKKDGFVGWSCTADFGDRTALRNVKIDPRAPSFLARTASAGSYAGAVLPNDANAPLLDLLEATQTEPGEIAVACAAVRAGGRPAILIVAHEISDPLVAPRTLNEIAQLAGEALERIVLTKR